MQVTLIQVVITYKNRYRKKVKITKFTKRLLLKLGAGDSLIFSVIGAEELRTN